MEYEERIEAEWAEKRKKEEEEEMGENHIEVMKAALGSASSSVIL